MSRIGKSPIPVPAGVEVNISGADVSVKGPKGQLQLTVASPITVAMADGQVIVTRPDDERVSRSLHGLTRTLIANQIIGVTQGYRKALEIVGAGFRVAAKGSSLEFALGYSHPINFIADEGITFKIDSPTEITVVGINKQLVGETAAKIQKLRKVDPYKGKGLHLEGAHIRRKQGKTGKK